MKNNQLNVIDIQNICSGIKFSKLTMIIQVVYKGI